MASLAGIETGTISTALQSGAITSHGSGFVPGAPADRRYQYNGLAFYGEHTYRISRRLTTTLGLRYENYSPVREKNNLLLRPDPISGNYLAGLLSPLGTMNFANGGAYHRDNLDFAPSFGVALIRSVRGRRQYAEAIRSPMSTTISCRRWRIRSAPTSRLLHRRVHELPRTASEPDAGFVHLSELQPPFSFSALGQGPIYTIDPTADALRAGVERGRSAGVEIVLRFSGLRRQSRHLDRCGVADSIRRTDARVGS